ncbi:hypothetical protein BJ546DRAFT_362277 [Cryomyces antarcticus]|nr:hypothetical protein LTR39_004537 [Cryomyces antarcticus]
MPSPPPSKNAINPNDKPRLSEQAKKENHIASEQKRRQAIREGFDRLASIVPGMEGLGRSEAVVLEATVKHMRDELVKRKRLLQKAKDNGIDVSTYELSKATGQV